MKSPQALHLGARNYREAHPAVDPILHQLNRELQVRAGHVGDICDKAGITVNTVRKWMRGSNSPTLSSLQALANCLGYTVTLVKNDEG